MSEKLKLLTLTEAAERINAAGIPMTLPKLSVIVGSGGGPDMYVQKGQMKLYLERDVDTYIEKEKARLLKK